MNVRLHEIAHARAGDKGNLNTISVIAREPRWYPVLCEELTQERVHAVLAKRMRGPLTVHRMDSVHALVLVFARSSKDTVTTSLHVDTHGKTLASLLLGWRFPCHQKHRPDRSSDRVLFQCLHGILQVTRTAQEPAHTQVPTTRNTSRSSGAYQSSVRSCSRPKKNGPAPPKR